MAENWIQEAEAKIRAKMPVVAGRSVHKVPYTSKDGVFDDWTNNISWWTNGFWGGMLWQLYHVTKDGMYLESALVPAFSPRFSLLPQSFHARIKSPAGLKRPAILQAASKVRLNDSSLPVSR